jgi:hypothetical protein
MKARTIESVRLDGAQRRTILRLEPKLGKPYRIEVFEDTVYFTTYRINKILRVNKFGLGNVSEVAEEAAAVVADLAIMQEQKQDNRHTAHPCRHNPCQKMGPNVMCVAVPAAESAAAAANQGLTSRCLCAADTALLNGKCVRRPVAGQGHPCDSISCHQGRCEVVDNAAVCRCNPFYVGEFCESYICADYCLNGGHCIPLDPAAGRHHNGTTPEAAATEEVTTTAAAVKALCVCKLGYYGERCELACGAYCRNNATCTSSAAAASTSSLAAMGRTQQQQVECQCRPPFTGPRCDQCPDMHCGAGYCTRAPPETPGESDQLMCRCPPLGALASSCDNNIKPPLPPAAADSGCAGFECHHNGTCRLDPASGQPECVCTDAMYSGRQCEWDKCKTVYCRNGGFGHRDAGRCVCACRKGFTGDKCENRLSDYINCDGVGCENGGLCKTINGRKLCACPPDFAGASCGTRLVGDQSRPCKEMVCENGGICQAVLLNKAAAAMPRYIGKCVCDNRYSGEYCQYANKCYKHCLNGGTCIAGSGGGGGNSVVCHCPPGWKGGRCQLNFGSEGRGEIISSYRYVPCNFLLT